MSIAKRSHCRKPLCCAFAHGCFPFGGRAGLTGKNKAETAEKYGEAQVLVWRRSFDEPPPPLEPDNEYFKIIQEGQSKSIAIFFA
jgi:hypothetical protein